MSSPEQAPRRQYVNFTFYKIDPAWRRLPEDERTRGKQEFLRAVEEYQGKVLVIAYTTVGIRGDCDLMLWRISYELELFQEMSTEEPLSRRIVGIIAEGPYWALLVRKFGIIWCESACAYTAERGA
jgi:chlorite dismutase